MIRHIVFLKLKENTQANKKLVADKIMSMDGKIDILAHIEVGLNFSQEERAYDVALIADFDSKEDLNTYASHPLHLEVIKYIKTFVFESKVVDYEK
ncbi:MAG: Dabb family protein [Sulfurospirillaceae bacterium]|nr:Dabb family protein [Sulfurospirillaceae bacterium]